MDERSVLHGIPQEVKDRLAVLLDIKNGFGPDGQSVTPARINAMKEFYREVAACAVTYAALIPNRHALPPPPYSTSYGFLPLYLALAKDDPDAFCRERDSRTGYFESQLQEKQKLTECTVGKTDITVDMAK